MTVPGSSPSDATAASPAVASREAPSAAETAIARDIEQTRAELGETVAQLAAKVDVSSRAQEVAGKLTAELKARAGQVTSQAARQRQRLTGRQAQVAGATATLVLAAVMLVRRRRR
jgi:hypothetical protein